jgi:hypothetical protein
VPNPVDVTNLFKAWSSGDPAALDRLAERVYGELRRDWEFARVWSPRELAHSPERHA